MKYQLRAKVDGFLQLPHGKPLIEADRDGIEFRLEANDNSDVEAISVSVRVPADEAKQFSAKMTSSDGERVDGLRIEIESEIHQLLRRELQDIESILAFNWQNHTLRRIRWDEVEMSLIPATPEEVDMVDVSHMTVPRARPPIYQVVTESTFATLVENAPKFKAYSIPAAFWREGMNHLDQQEFVLAFYSFYFMIEDFYADGKTRVGPVMDAFSKSDEFNWICSNALQSYPETAPAHLASLKAMFSEENCNWDVPGLRKFLFAMRGNSHHYFSKSTKLNPTPFNQDRFECVALLAMFIASVALSLRISKAIAKHEPVVREP